MKHTVSSSRTHATNGAPFCYLRRGVRGEQRGSRRDERRRVLARGFVGAGRIVVAVSKPYAAVHVRLAGRCGWSHGEAAETVHSKFFFFLFFATFCSWSTRYTMEIVHSKFVYPPFNPRPTGDRRAVTEVQTCTRAFIRPGYFVGEREACNRTSQRRRTHTCGGEWERPSLRHGGV